VVGWFTLLAVGAAIDTRHWEGVGALPYVAAAVMGLVVAGVMFVAGRSK
jgi:hypothetical protein